jgi:penicillin-binding protein 1B
MYFHKDVGNLTLPEAALLAGMISAPNRNAPTRNTELARGRRALVLQQMAEQRRISQSAAEHASRARLLTRAWPATAVEGRWFRDYVAAQGGNPRVLPGRGVAVYTTLDATLQRAAERAVRNGLARMRAPDIQASVVAIDPRTGELLAMVGGRDYAASQFNRATDARRQPGSAFKPVVALAALDRWEGRDPTFTLASVVQDEPLRVGTPNGPWEPTDYDGEFRGPVTVREAMEQSLNVPFARIGLAVGPDRIVAAARRLGIASPLRAVPSLALGSSEVTLMELVRAYGVFAAGGDLALPRAIFGQARYGEEARDTAAAQVRRAVDPAVAYLVTSTLEGVVTRGTGRALNQDGRFGGEGIAGKTGTSSEWRDAWFIAYSPALVVGVWVGYDDGRSLGMTGAGAALPIAAGFLDEAANGAEWQSFEAPDGITEGYASLASGGAWSDCEGGTREIFLEGTEPQGTCSGPWIQGLEQLREWGGELKRRAARVLEELFSPESGARQSRP